MFLDFHTVHVIGNGLRYYQTHAAEFRRLLANYAIPTALADEWFASIFPPAPVPAGRPALPMVRMVGGPGADVFPQVAVEVIGESPEVEFLGGEGEPDEDGRNIRLTIEQHTVLVTVFAHQVETTAALHVLVHAILALATPAFMAAGYQDWHPSGGDALSFEEQLVAQNDGVCARRRRWQARTGLLVPEHDVPVTKSWFVATDDVVVDGEPGGISPYRA